MERRVHERYEARQYEDANPIYRVYPYRILNISRSGCALESAVPLPIETGPQRFEIPLHYRATILRAEVRLVWQTPGTDARGRTMHRLGLHFGELDEENRLALDEYVASARQATAMARLENAWDRVRRVQEEIGSLVPYRDMDEKCRRELDSCLDLIGQGKAADRMDRAWETVRDIQRRIQELVERSERRGPTGLQ